MGIELMGDLFILVLVTILCIFGLFIYLDYKEAQEQKRQTLLDRIPCICGHANWLHYGPFNGPQSGRCSSFRGDIFVSQCQCIGYKMDNLKYLEERSNAKS